MNFWQTFLLLSASQGILLSLGLISAGLLKKWSNFFLGLTTLVISLEILTTWAILTNYTNQPNRIAFWNLSSYLIWPAAIYLFSLLNTKPQFKLQRWHWWLLVPAFIEIIVEVSTDLSNNYMGTSFHPYQNPLWYSLTEILPIFAMVVVLFLFGKNIILLERQLKQIGNKKNNTHLIKVKAIFFLFTMSTSLWFLEVFIQLPIFKFTLLLFCFFIFVLGYISFLQPDFFSLPAFLTKAPSSQFTDNSQELAVSKNIHDTFIKKKLYLQPKLTLKEAAKQLDLPPRSLSTLINKYHGVDFRRYLNTLRVEEVIQKVQQGEKEQKTLLGIALESGFNSKSAFNQTFKDLKGKSPSEYFKQ